MSLGARAASVDDSAARQPFKHSLDCNCLVGGACESCCLRRIQRDVAMRGRDIAGVIEQYTRFVKPAFDTFVAPSRKHADIIIPWGG